MTQLRSNYEMGMVSMGISKLECCNASETGIGSLNLTDLLRRLSCTMHSTLSHLQLPQGAPSTTSHLTFRLLQLMQALAALRFVTFVEPLGSEVEADRFLDWEFESAELEF